ncbi:hypothetical protein N825_23290 [Skermanella stibiiresistens SB22]|uniref:CHAT domain-containing protein n=1 Tax=Skermanella stibiiresistens SB22 TaxID=1385369 RepID=W9GWH7_9PROT|nr:CHAT domain-containing protein [Skermanella stibiiresistens]EWY36802.1 hypothetical protein N825_23290 [Skermanella stibiiresistens SB22]
MLNARIELAGAALKCSTTRPGASASLIPLTPERQERLRRWATDYDNAVRARQPEALPAIGRDIAALLDEGGGWLERALDSVGDIALEIRVPSNPTDPDDRALAQALLDLPWELLTAPGPSGHYLALDHTRLFRVARRIGTPPPPSPEAPATPLPGDLTLLFMAAEVEGQHSLSYEREEAAILDATASLDRLHLLVEESGGIEGLRDRLAQTGAVEALHITSHGEIVNGQPLLALEAPDGTLDPVGIAGLRNALGAEERYPRLVVLSACRTAEAEGSAGSFIQEVIRAGIPNALGWDGSVYDSDATSLAAAFYGELAASQPVTAAAAMARRALLQAHTANPDTGRHWHLARVYLGPGGGEALCDPTADRREFDNGAGIQEFLDRKGERVPVATAAQFVGRRRQIQRALRALGPARIATAPAGVLIHGMGCAGKSSLAARVANRLRGHHTVVLVDDYGPDALLHELEQALPPEQRASFRSTWSQKVDQDPEALKDALDSLLKGPFSGRNGNSAILLVIDDLEQRLKQPQPGETATPFKTALDKTVFGAIIAAFRDARTTASRLLLTSRYTFDLTDRRGKDLAACLATIPLPPMDAVERAKQMRAAASKAGTDRDQSSAARQELEARIQHASGGNPGLQHDLTAPLLAGDLAAAERLVGASERYLQTGTIPKDAAEAVEFFRRVPLDAFRAMLTGTEVAQLGATTLFSLPVPLSVLAVTGTAAGVGDPAAALDRLHGLGLLDHTDNPGTAPDGMCGPLVRPLVTPLSPKEAEKLAAAVIEPLVAAWTDDDGELPWDQRRLAAAHLALLGRAPTAIISATAYAGGRFLFNRLHDARSALDLCTNALAITDERKAPPSPALILVGTQCAERLGETDLLDHLLDRGLEASANDLSRHAMLLAQVADRRRQTGDLNEAEGLLERAKSHFETLGDVRSRAVTMGRIVDILQARGELDEALRIRREELLPVFNRLGDVCSRAVTMGKIADILRARGEMDEALRIHREEQLLVYDRLGDVRERAVTMGKIADILQARGDMDEALRIRREEELPVYDRLGDVRSRAVTIGKIADILRSRGELDEALRIRRKEELPVYDRLGDVRSRAVTMGKIADILRSRGELDEALRIRREEELPVYDRLGDVRSRAVTMGKIADILQACGELDESLRVRLEDSLPIHRCMGDVHSIAYILYRCADLRVQRGEKNTDELQRTIDEFSESLGLFLQLGAVGFIFVVGRAFGQLLAALGQNEDAYGVLDHTASAAEKLQRFDDVRTIRDFQATLKPEAE